MIDIDSQFMALKATWIPLIYNGPNDIWTTLPKYYIEKATSGLMFTMTATSLDKLPHLTTQPEFYKDVIIGYTKSKCHKK